MTTAKLVASSYSVTGTVVVNQNETSLYKDTSNSSNPARITHTTSGTSSYYLYLKGFDFSDIPDDAEVSDITISVKGYESGLSTSTSYAPRLYNNTSGTTWSTITGASAASSNFGTSSKTITVPYTGTWAALKSIGSNLGIRLVIRRSSRNTQGYLYIYGAEIEVTYTVPVYHSVTVSNSTSTNVEAVPSSVLEGEDCEVRADSLSGLTIKDNNVDVTSQFTQRTSQGYVLDYENRGSYGFALSNGYYVSQNKGVDKSCAVCRVHFFLEDDATVTFSYINYAEASYDFGVFGNIDVALTTNYYPAGSGGATISETSYKKACNTSSDNTSTVKTLTYSMTAGEHFIDVKFSKDDGTGSNNDTLQFQVAVSVNGTWPKTYYGYDIANIQADHVILVSSSGAQPELYVKINGTWKQVSAAYKKVNGSWVQQQDLTQVFQSGVNYKWETA